MLQTIFRPIHQLKEKVLLTLADSLSALRRRICVNL